ncbi:MAG: PHP domain-containing protein [Methylovirgula sp.]
MIGIELTLDFGDGARLASRGGETAAGRAEIVLLAQDETGYLNLMHLASQAWLLPEPGDLPHLPVAMLAARTAGLLALTSGPDGVLDRCFAFGRPEAAEHRLDVLQACFGGRVSAAGFTLNCSVTVCRPSAKLNRN